MGLKEWIKNHWIWSIIIGIILVYIAVSFLPSMYGPAQGTDEASRSSADYGAMTEEPSYDSGYESEAPARSMAAPGESASTAGQPEVAERKITKAASIDTEVETGKFKETESKAKEDISSLDAFILNEDVQLHKSGDAAYYTGRYTIKVESGKYDSLVAKLKEIPKLQQFSESADDITEQYTDLEVELKAEKERLERYRALYAEINDTEDKIDLIDMMFYEERAIEYMEKALTEAGKTLDYYTIDFYLAEKEPSFFNVEFVEASELAANIVDGTSSLLRLASYLLPFLAVGFGIWGIRRTMKKKAKEKR